MGKMFPKMTEEEIQESIDKIDFGIVTALEQINAVRSKIGIRPMEQMELDQFTLNAWAKGKME